MVHVLGKVFLKLFSCPVQIVGKFQMFTLFTSCDVGIQWRYTNCDGSSILGYVNFRFIFQQISEAWGYAPLDLKLGKVCFLFVSNNITISQLYSLNGFQNIFCHCMRA